MAEKLKNKVTDEELKIRATSDEKITMPFRKYSKMPKS